MAGAGREALLKRLPMGTEPSFSDGVMRVLKQVHPDLDISPSGLNVMLDLCHDTLARLMDAVRDHLPCTVRTHLASATRIRGERTLAGEVQYLVYHEGSEAAPRWVLAPDVLACPPEVVHTWQERGEEDKGKQLELALTEAEDEEGFHPSFPIFDPVTVHCIQRAVNLSIGGELAKHAVSEGTKSLSSFFATPRRPDESATFAAELAREPGKGRRGLSFPIATVGVLASLRMGRNVSAEATVYLSAVLEYMAAECLELGGNAAKVQEVRKVTARLLMLAIRTDEELDGFFPNHFLYAGVVPYIHQAMRTAKMEDVRLWRDVGDPATVAEVCAVLLQDRRDEQAPGEAGTWAVVLCKAHLDALAARAGAIALHSLVYAELHGVAKEFAERLIRAIHCRTDKTLGEENCLQAVDVLAAQRASRLRLGVGHGAAVGTGQLGTLLRRSAIVRSEESAALGVPMLCSAAAPPPSRHPSAHLHARTRTRTHTCVRLDFFPPPPSFVRPCHALCCHQGDLTALSSF